MYLNEHTFFNLCMSQKYLKLRKYTFPPLGIFLGWDGGEPPINPFFRGVWIYWAVPNSAQLHLWPLSTRNTDHFFLSSVIRSMKFNYSRTLSSHGYFINLKTLMRNSTSLLAILYSMHYQKIIKRHVERTPWSFMLSRK